MRRGQVGGSLAIGGWACLIVAIAMAMSGSTVGIGNGSAGSIVLAGAIGLLGAGAAVMGIVGPPPLDSRALRVGMGILALGLFSSLASSIIAVTSPTDPLASGPWIATFILSGVATAFGAVVTSVALALTPGQARVAGGLLIAGIALVITAWSIGRASADSLSPAPAPGILAFVGCIAIALGGIAVGALAIRGESPATRTSS